MTARSNRINYTPENHLQYSPESPSISKIILEKSEKCVCQLKSNSPGTGFFCLIPFPDKSHLLPVLITCYHIFDKDCLLKRKIELVLNGKTIEIKLENDRKVYLNKKLDVTIIEIKTEDGFDINSFLETDDDLIFKENNEGEKIYLHPLKYPRKKTEIPNNGIQGASEEKNKNEQKSSTKLDSAGSPIINLINFKVFGVYKERLLFYSNFGIILKKPILQFIHQKKTLEDIENYKDEITIIYNRAKSFSDKMRMLKDNLIYYGEKESRNKLFGEKFVENNKSICKMEINGKEYELNSFFQDANNKIKEDVFQIKLKGISKIADASFLFYGCISLISLPDISKWDTSNVSFMSNLFSKCCSLANLDDISGWDTSNVIVMNAMFFNCRSLTSLPDISRWDTSRVIDFGEMFGHCTSLINLPDISKWKTSNATSMRLMFEYCSSLTNFPDISNWNVSNVTDMEDLFYHCNSLKNLPDISKWNTSNVTNMKGIFYNCTSLKTLPDISKWNTSNVIKMESMFAICTSLKTLPDISIWDTSNVINMSSLFQICESLETLPDISKWNTSNVTDMSFMFNCCKRLKILPEISKWDISRVTSRKFMFFGCNSKLNFPNFKDKDNCNIF